LLRVTYLITSQRDQAVEHPYSHPCPESQDRQKYIKGLGKASILEEGLEVFMLLTLQVVLQDGPPRAGRIVVRWTAQMAFIEPNSLVNQSIRGPALV
jgi:hypothetical protein